MAAKSVSRVGAEEFFPVITIVFHDTAQIYVIRKMVHMRPITSMGTEIQRKAAESKPLTMGAGEAIAFSVWDVYP